MVMAQKLNDLEAKLQQQLATKMEEIDKQNAATKASIEGIMKSLVNN